MSKRRATRQSLAGLTRFGSLFWPYVRAQWRLIIIGLIGLIASSLMRILEPWPLKFVIDRITDQASDRARISIAAINNLDTQTLLMLAAGCLIAIAALRAIMSYASTIGFALAGNRTLTKIRAALFEHLQGLSLRFHGKSRNGDITVRMIGDIGMMQEVAVTALLPLLGNVLILFGMFGVMFWLDPLLAAISLVTLPLFAVATLHRGKRIRHAARRTRKQEGALAATAAESLSAIKTVQSLALGDRFLNAFNRQNTASLSEGVRVKRLSAGLERGVDVLIALATAAVLWFGAARVMAGKLSAGELLVFLFYLKGAFRPLRDFAKYGARLAKASAAADRIAELFEAKADVVESADARPLTTIGGQIQLSNVNFGYEPDKRVLHEINLLVNPHEHIALIGHSGSGKSTIAALVLRLYDPDQGEVRIDGQDLRNTTIASLRSQISTVLQDTVLFSGTLRDNIAFGMLEASDEQVIDAARLANAHEFIQELPDGYQTVVGERGVNLSNGQRQRIAIARAAMRNAPILILDEPTTGLDPQNERLVLEALHRLSRNKTTLHITHRPGAARLADRIVVLNGGKIVDDGTYEGLLRNGSSHARLLLTSTDNQEQRHAANR